MLDETAPISQRARARLFVAGIALALLCSPPAAAASRLSHEPAAPVSPATATVWHGAQDLAIYALGLIGVDYKFGGTSPERGLDCSGLVRYVFQQVTGVTLPRTSQELSRLGSKIPVADLMPGDLVFFNTRRFQFSHVGIYLGGDRFIHAPRQGGEVEVVTLSQSYWHKRFDGARRLVGALPDLIPSAKAETAHSDTQSRDSGAPAPEAPSAPTPEEPLP